MKGWVYVVSNKAMPGLIKIGYSMKDPELRAAQLNNTGSPHPYIVDYEVLVENPRDIEQTTHHRLRNRREGKEWFRCSPEEAIAEIRSVVGSRVQAENFKRADRAKADLIRQQKETKEAKEKTIRELVAKRKEVESRYDSLLRAAAPGENLFVLLCGVFGVLFFSLAFFVPNIKATPLITISIIGAFIIAPLVKKQYDESAKESAQYKSIISRREADLRAIENSIQELTKN